MASSFERQKGARRACSTANRLRSAWMRRISARALGSLSAMSESQAPRHEVDIEQPATEDGEAHHEQDRDFPAHGGELGVERRIELARIVRVLGEARAHLLEPVEVV